MDSDRAPRIDRHRCPECDRRFSWWELWILAEGSHGNPEPPSVCWRCRSIWRKLVWLAVVCFVIFGLVSYHPGLLMLVVVVGVVLAATSRIWMS